MTALLAASCIKDEPICSTCDENPDGRGILLSFNDGTDTRSELHSSEVDYRDVKYVYLYVFEGTGADAKCILSEDVDWKGDISQEHWISADLTADDYTFLAVGVDDNAGKVYGLTASYKGTLDNCLAKLAEGKDKSDMATAQVFAGFTTQNVAEEDDVVKVGITLTRKVAGVLVYLRNIPCKVDFDEVAGGKANVTGIRLVLAQPQNTQMPMWPIATDEAPIYGSNQMEDTEENRTLFSYNLADIGFTEDEDGRYFVKETQEDKILPNTLLYGAYLLPIENTTQNNTLKLELIGDYIDGTGSQTGKVVKTYTIQNPEGESNFSLEENKLYCIGKKLSDDSTEGDKPADLSGNVLTISVEDWCDHYIPNVFPTVTAPARVVGDYNPENYIFDAPGTTTTVTVYPPTGDNASGKSWKMYIEYGDGENEPNDGLNKDEKDWIHIVSKNAEGGIIGYTNELLFSAGSKETKVDLVLNDFAVCRSNMLRTPHSAYRYSPENIEMAKNDYRTAYVVVLTDSYSTPYRLKIRQYNTLSVYAGETPPWIGTGRLDYGCTFDKMTGEAICVENSNPDNNSETGHTLNNWGYPNRGSLTIVGYSGDMNTDDGEINLNDALDENTDYFGESLMCKVMREIILITYDESSESYIKQDVKNQWYLPAYQEIADLIKYPADNEDCKKLFNMGWSDKNYWSSTGKIVDGVPPYNSYYVEFVRSHSMYSTDRTEYLLARPVRKFLE